MNDYLWDKTGEPDEEVERLEELLGGLRYQPRELELLPVTQAPHAKTRGRWRWPGLAVAAALALMGLAGFWLVQQRDRARVSPAPVAVQVKQTAGAREASREIEKQASAKVETAHNDEEASLHPHRHASASQPLPHQSQRRKQGRVGPKISGPEDKNASPANLEAVAALAAERRREQLEQQAEGVRAKEELMLALQVASTKLNHAQRKAKGSPNIPGPGSEKPAVPTSMPWNKTR